MGAANARIIIADVQRAIETHILPGHTALAQATDALASYAAENCAPDAVRPPFHAAYDAWISISHIQFGPIEDQALTLQMSFWPDPKDSTGKALGRLVAAQDPIVDALPQPRGLPRSNGCSTSRKPTQTIPAA